MLDVETKTGSESGESNGVQVVSTKSGSTTYVPLQPRTLARVSEVLRKRGYEQQIGSDGK